MNEKYKRFPPTLGNLLVPVSSRKAALAGINMYAASRRAGLVTQRVSWHLTRRFGPMIIPSRTVVVEAPIEDKDAWNSLVDVWKQELGRFDSLAIHRPREEHRRGVAVLLLDAGEPVAFVKLRRDVMGAAVLANENESLSTIWKHRPTTFQVVEPLGHGAVEGWHYLATAPLPTEMHRPPHRPLIDLIGREVRESLSARPRPPHVPSSWVPVHGDFTPWNLRQFRIGKPFLLDWEQSGWGPLWTDEVLYAAASHVLDLAAPVFQIPDSNIGSEQAMEAWREHWGNRNRVAPTHKLPKQFLRALELPFEKLIDRGAATVPTPTRYTAHRPLLQAETRWKAQEVLAKLRPIRAKPGRMVVLCYHSISRETSFASASPELFDQHLAWLADHCRVISLAEISRIPSPTFDAQPTVALSFDDGYQDNYTDAMPALLRYDLPATFFLTTGFLDGTREVSERMCHLLGAPADQVRPMTWSQLSEMQAAGFTFGAHTVSHPNLRWLTDHEVLDEVNKSIDTIGSRLGQAGEIFAYPFGKPGDHFTDRTEELVAMTGQRLAVTTVYRGIRTQENPYRIPRFSITGDTLEVLKAKVLGSLDLIGFWQEKAPRSLARMISGDVSRPLRVGRGNA